MKKVLLVAVVAVMLAGTQAGAIEAFGSAFGTLTTAQSIGMGNASFLGSVGIADATSVYGAFRYGFSDYLEGRVKLGLIDADDDAEITFGADMSYQLWVVNQQSKDPLELAFGGMFEFVSPGDGTLWQLGGFVTGSYPFLLTNGMTLSPYGRFNIRLENSSSDGPGGDNSELEFGLNGGAMLKITDYINTYGEFQLDGNDGVFLGVEFLLQ